MENVIVFAVCLILSVCALSIGVGALALSAGLIQLGLTLFLGGFAVASIVTTALNLSK